MKLHLPGKLRAALLACYAISASLVTTISSGSFVGGALVATAAAVAASQQAYAAATIVCDGGSLTGFNYGTLISTPSAGDVSFSKDDNVTFIADTDVTLGGNITAGIFAIQKDVVLDLSSNGYKLDAAFEVNEGLLRLSSEALAENAEVYRSTSGRVEVAWGAGAASLSSQLSNFAGVLDVNDTTYVLAAGESGYSKLVLRGSEGNGSLLTQSATYSLPLLSVGSTSINVSENSTVVTGMLSGFGSVTKEGSGTLTLKGNNVFYYGDLIISEGVVRWGESLDGDESAQAVNRMMFANIIVNKDAVFDDSHMGRSMVNSTSVTLIDGTLRSFATGYFLEWPDVTGAVNPTCQMTGASWFAQAWDDMTVNTYKTLFVQGTGTVDAERTGGHRFFTLSSLNAEDWEEGSAPSETTLTLSNGTQHTSVIIEKIENFHGSITSLDTMDDNHQFRVNGAHQDDGYAVEMTMDARAFGFSKSGDGSVKFAKTFTAKDFVDISGGEVVVDGAFKAEGVTISHGSMVVEQDAFVQEMHISGDGAFLTGQKTTALTVEDELRVSGGSLSLDYDTQELIATDKLLIDGGKTHVAGKVTAGDVTISGNAETSLFVGGEFTVESFAKKGAAQFRMAEEDAQSPILSVSRNFTMNYGGEADSFNGGDFSNIRLQDGIVLTYYSGAPNVVKLGYGRSWVGSNVEYMFADVFDVTAADLAKGINLGIESDGSLSRVEHMYVSTLGVKGVDYVIEIGADNYYYLRTLKGQTATTSWDIRWGTEEVSSAPEHMPKWEYTSIDDVGLYGSPYDDNGFFIASELVGTNAVGAPDNDGEAEGRPGDDLDGFNNANPQRKLAVNVFGGAYDSIDPEGIHIKRDIWLKATGGDFNLITAGSLTGSDRAVAGWSLEGDTHVYITSEIGSIGSVVGGNFLCDFEPSWKGDGYITIDSSTLSGSVFGSGYDAVSHEGDSTIFVYKALGRHIPTPVNDFTIGDTEHGLGLNIGMNTIAGGQFTVRSSQWYGDGKIVVDLINDDSTNKMVKSLVGGSFAIMASEQELLTKVGDNSILVTNTCAGDYRVFTNFVVGGDLVFELGSSDMTGDTFIEISHLGQLTYFNGRTYSPDNTFVVGGHLSVQHPVASPPYIHTSNFTVTGNTHIRVTDAANGVFNGHIVAGNVAVREGYWSTMKVAGTDWPIADDGEHTDAEKTVEAWNPTGDSMGGAFERRYVGTIDGDTYIDIDSGNFKGMIVGGHYYEDFIHDALPDNPGEVPVHPRQWTCFDTLIVTGHTNITLTGGNYHNTVLGATYYDGWDDVIMYTGGVEIKISNSHLIGRNNDYKYAVVGGYYIDEYLHDADAGGPYASYPETVDTTVTVEDINITFEDNVTDGIVLGGSHILRSASGRGGVRQGHITINMLSGIFNANIYAAGAQESDTLLYTESTTIRLTDEVEFGKNVTVSGGYKGHGASAVHGDMTLEFISPTKYENIANTNFTFFDVVKVTEKEGYVVLPHNATLLGDYITKRGAGTLELGVQNDLDMLTVSEGTLKLAANSAGTPKGTKIEQLNLAKGATLDLTAGNCGINGDFVVEGGSTILIGTGLTPTAIERLIWDDSEKVMLTLSAIPTGSDSYVVELFSGLSKADIIGLDMRVLDEGYGVRASQYIDSNVDLTNSYLLLQGDTLVLTKAPRRSIYWEYKGGTSGYWLAEDAWAKKDEQTPDTVFNNEPGYDNVVFSNNTATITVNQEVLPYDIYVQNGEYTFTGESKEAVITPYGSIVLMEGAKATFTEDVKLNTNADTTLIALQDDACMLEINNDISIYSLQNKGLVKVNGDVVISTGTDNGGVLIVDGGDLTVGGDSTFSELQVEGSVKNNSEFVLTTDGISSVGAIDGGIVGVQKGGELTINPDGAAAKTILRALQGAGAVTTKNVLELTGDSKIGNLSASSLALGGTLQSTGSVMIQNDLAVSDSVTIAGALTARSITYNHLNLRSDYAMIDVEGDVAQTGSVSGNGIIQMNVDTTMIATRILSDGKEYYLLKCDEGGLDADVVFGAEGVSELTARNDRYDYTAYTVNDGVVLRADLKAPHLFADYVAETSNGLTGAEMLDALYKDATILEQHPNGDLALTMEAINQQLMINNSKEGLDDLFAAVAGASIPAMGVAFADDISRQMQAIRNRTTTMGVDQCAVNENMPYFNAWINAEGGNRNLDKDGTSSGYDLSSWGGTVGFDVDFSPRFTAGIAVSAMYGDYTANAPDDGEGDFDTQYVTAFARYGYRSWVHTFVASVGRADASLERTVSHQYGSYRTKGETDGLGFGLMYEVGYVRSLNESGTACIQPVMNFALTKASLDGYTEEDSDAGLKVGDIDMTTLTVGAGARIQAVIGENLYNRASIFECRALAKFRAGDRNAETEVGFAAAAMGTGTVESAEMGNVGIELGAGIVVPLGAEHSSIFADVSAEFSTGYTSVNGTVGYRINF